jgi:diguanylate cyclase (GGDEF)-like protein
MTGHHLNVLNILAEHAALAIQRSGRFEREHELAHSDPLTGLANSRNLVRHLERLCFQGSGSASLRDGSNLAGPDPRPLTPGPCFSVVVMDLDRFKEVNDTQGHLEGDELLRRVAARLESVARPDDVVCRYAGDEFVLLLGGADRREAVRIAERAREAIDSLPEVAGKVKISASMGVSTYPDDGPDGRTLLHVADQRMYEDKFQRRRSVRLPADEAALTIGEEPPVSVMRAGSHPRGN